MEVWDRLQRMRKMSIKMQVRTAVMVRLGLWIVLGLDATPLTEVHTFYFSTNSTYTKLHHCFIRFSH